MLRSREAWAPLTLYQLLRMAMVTAVQTRPGTDPDRASFTTAIEAARDQLTAARGICPDGPADLPGVIPPRSPGHSLACPAPPLQRPQSQMRHLPKCYLNRDDGRPNTPAAIIAIDITICAPPAVLNPAKPARPHRARSASSSPEPGNPQAQCHRDHGH